MTTPDEEGLQTFRSEVRSFLECTLTPDLRQAAEQQIGITADGHLGRKWQRLLFEKGWATPMWPLEHGGLGWSLYHKYIFEQECARAEAPILSAAGLVMCGPIIIEFGTPAQKAKFLPSIRSGETYWCQGYSEPGAGSDLASLSCKAVREGDDYIINGTKLWTTHAQYADWMFMLVRTSSSGRKQEGITFLLADMKSTGVMVEPILSMSGDHEVNQVFFDSVRIPTSNRIGSENDGWNIAKHLLEFERSIFYGPRIRRILWKIERDVKSNAPAWQQQGFLRRFAEVSIEADILEAMELKMLANEDSSISGVATSLLKVTGTEVLQRATELGVCYAGCESAYSIKHSSASKSGPGAVMMARYLNTRAATIYGGSSEIQRNIIAQSTLHL